MKSTCNGPVAWQKGDLRAISCQSCGFMHLDPLPTQAELTQLYQDEYYQEYNAGWFKKEKREWWYWRRVYQQRCRRFELLHRSTKKARVYDWGAGAGWFCRAASAHNPTYTVEGYEPNEYAREWAKTHTALVAHSAENCRDEDFIHLSLVLEHVKCPLGLLEILWGYLVPGGLLCVVVPNEYDPTTGDGNDLQRQMAERFGYSPLHEHHLSYFTPLSLVRLAERAGFSIVHLGYTFPMELFALRTPLKYPKYPKLGKVAHWARMLLEWGAAVSLWPWAWLERKQARWAALGWGREIEAWLQK
jgi:SAM-dependent methyltransferase